MPRIRIVNVTPDMLPRRSRPVDKPNRSRADPRKLQASLGELAIERQMRRVERQRGRDGDQA